MYICVYTHIHTPQFQLPPPEKFARTRARTHTLTLKHTHTHTHTHTLHLLRPQTCHCLPYE